MGQRKRDGDQIVSGVPPSDVTRSCPSGASLVSTVPPPLRVGAERRVAENVTLSRIRSI